MGAQHLADSGHAGAAADEAYVVDLARLKSGRVQSLFDQHMGAGEEPAHGFLEDIAGDFHA